MAGHDKIPTFRELPAFPDSDERHAWDVWGRDDELGSMNHIGAEQIMLACKGVREGRVISLTLPLDQPDPGLFHDREPYRHTVTTTRMGRDDRLDSFYPQYSSQWDGLRHIRYREHGYWGGRQDEDLDTSDVLGIDRWAERGIVGRGVVVDVVGYLRRRGKPLPLGERYVITADLIKKILEFEGVELAPGDILTLRTGWTQWFIELTPQQRSTRRIAVNPEFACPGLDPTARMAEFLWDHRVSAVIADNAAIEALPVSAADGFLHRRLIAMLGIAFGELFYLAELADACEDQKRYDYLLMAAPLRIPRGVGSPANAYAVV